MTVLRVFDDETLADVLLHLPRHPRVVVEGAERIEKFFPSPEKAKNFLLWAYWRFVRGGNGVIYVVDDEYA